MFLPAHLLLHPPALVIVFVLLLENIFVLDVLLQAAHAVSLLSALVVVDLLFAVHNFLLVAGIVLIPTFAALAVMFLPAALQVTSVKNSIALPLIVAAVSLILPFAQAVLSSAVTVKHQHVQVVH